MPRLKYLLLCALALYATAEHDDGYDEHDDGYDDEEDFESEHGDEAEDDEEDIELRNSLSWGRIYLDRGVTHQQYFKATFGGDIPFGLNPVEVSDPPMACTPLENNVTGKIVFVRRGNCTFATKARFVQKAGGVGAIVINTDDTLSHPPGPDGKDITIPVAMVTKDGGEMVSKVVSRQSTSARLLPIFCDKDSGTSVCLPVTEEERSYHKDYEGGTLVTNDEKASRFEFLTAKFGSPLPVAGKDLGFVVAEPVNACQDLSNADQVRGKIVVIKRGGCPFTDKAYSVERAGGIVAVMVNNHRTILRMDSLKRYESYNISISMVMVTNNAGDHLMSMSGTGKTIHFEDGNVTSEEWIGLKNSVSAEQWPMDPQECHDVFMKLREAHKNSPERLALLESAYLETGPEAEEELKKLNKNSNFRN